MFRFKGYTLDIACSALRTADRDLQLRPKSFEVLRYLLENADRIVTKQELMKAVWPNVMVTDQVLAHCVSEVREAIGDGEQAIIKTIPRRGYRFTAPVLRVATSAAAAPKVATPILGVEDSVRRCGTTVSTPHSVGVWGVCGDASSSPHPE
jgi:DNA-binding winged helix-turn-helix (wHTH) protein